MKKTVLLLCFPLFLLSALMAQEWQYELNSDLQIFYEHTTLEKTPDGSYLYLVRNQLFEVSEYGELMYSYDLNEGNFFSATTFVRKKSDGFLVGVNNASNLANGQLELHKMSKSGDLVWQKTFPRPSLNTLKHRYPVVAEWQSDELFMAGVDSIYLLNANSGQVSWRKALNTTDRIFVAAAADANDIAVITSIGELFRLDANGNTINSLNLNMEVFEMQSIQNHYVVAGKNTNTGDAQIILVNKSNNNISTQTYGTGEIHDLQGTYDGGFILAGGDGNQGYLIKTDGTGTLEWQQFYSEGTAKSVEVSDYDGFVATIVGSDRMVRLFKTDAQGNTATSIEQLLKNKNSIDISNIKTIVGGDGMMFWDGENSRFNVPKDSATTTVFAAGLWMSALGNGSLKIAADDYRSVINSDYQAGYIGSGCDPSLLNKVWKVNREWLRDFKNDIADGTADRPIPHDILTWPGEGNPHFKGVIDSVLSLNSKLLAPFVDVNLDGIYNALDGDYPDMKGDEMLWFVFNDDVLHMVTQGDPLKVEIACSVYGYDCDGNDDLYNSLFLEYKIYNRSSVQLDSMKVGLWNDLDIGCFTDDFVGSVPSDDFFYIYNDGQDGVGGCGSNVVSFGNNMPIQSVAFLNNPMSSFVYYPNGGFITDPSIGNQFYNLLNGKWSDGSSLSACGNGYLQSGCATTNYAFSGNPSTANDWSMCNINTQGIDVRGLGTTKVGTLPVNGVVEVKSVYTFHENIPQPCPDIQSEVTTNVSNVKNLFNSNSLDWNVNLGSDQTLNLGSTLTLHPNQTGNSYLWSTGATTSTIDISSPGVYNVSITDANGCTKSDDIHILGYTNASEMIEMVNTKVFPNPANDQLFVEFEVENGSPALTFLLSNILGQTLVSKNVNASKGQVTFNVNDLPVGVYMISIEQEGKIINVEKVLIE